MQNLSLLNSIVGPVMRGPSSSHSAGPYHIANTIRQLTAGCGEYIDSVRIGFNPSGSFAAVYSNQGSDEGFAAGFLGIPITDDAYLDALRRFQSGQLYPFTFEVTTLVPNDHPNRVQIDVQVRQTDGNIRSDRFRAVSTGGGMFVIDDLNGHSIEVTGTEHVVLVEGDADAVPDALAREDLNWRTAVRASNRLSQFAFAAELSAEALVSIAGLSGVERVRVTGPSQLCVASTDTLLVSGAALGEPNNLGLAEKALELESIRLGLPRHEVRRLFEERLELMLTSVENGLRAAPSSDRMKFLTPSALRIKNAILPPIIGAGFLQNAMSAALAVMEQDTNRGVVVAAPTAGSAGIVPGVLFALSQVGVAESMLVDSLQVMALVGGAFAARGSFAAETGGCSVETGASAAMAAGGMSHILGAGPQQVFGAASLCLMNTLGLVCDPVGGEVEIPCHARNIAGVSHAYAASIATLAGFDAVLPFDDVVQATVDVGKLMHPDLRCTGRGGCAAFCPAPKGSDASGSKTFVPLTLKSGYKDR
ncbi:L-serine ammonia-lyase, iron-sulfur-dependent, subunit alpha [Streptomyces sp. GbtcB6]|uniref:L-serine ammonia-lyase, iron-sulfur-dependent, subunit alpha n=1 Tax=Streptomyces sp. GbtcB6 TaxID=2824751 RepID=UPI001C303A2F|nr:L-serine ammonia-lyase, iron-sulfur-dependent, subunit alpha [Streptomyces sp. GbtcB6]